MPRRILTPEEHAAQLAYDAAYRAKNRERIRANHAAWRESKRDRCREIGRKAAQKWRDRNPEKFKESVRRYAQANTENVKANNQKWRTANKEKIRQQSRIRNRRFYAAHSDTLRVKQADYYVSNLDKVKARNIRWSKANPLAMKAKALARRARKLNAGGKCSAKDIEAMWHFQNGKCTYCDVPLSESCELDHWIPLSRGGSNDRTNGHLTCMPHNRHKAARDPIEYEAAIGFVRTRPVGAPFLTNITQT